MSLSPTIDRRQFLSRTTTVLTAPMLVSAGVLGLPGCRRPVANERVTVGIVGLGAQGFDNLRQMLRLADVQVVAVCDVDTLHYRDNPWGEGPPYGREPAQAQINAHYATAQKSGTYSGCASMADYRELCARNDIDAVVISTPDHWHALCALEAIRAGKDVYGEKPLTHFFEEARVLCDVVAQHKAIFQTGTQQRSTPVFRRAVEIVRNGHLGRIKRIEVGLPDGYEKPMGDDKVETPPEHLDYEMWTGPAPMLPYMRARSHRWWRGNRAYGGGTLMDWIGHHNDIAEWGLAPEAKLESAEAVGWTFPETAIYDTPVHFEIRCRYAGGIESSISDRHQQGTKWIGERGSLYVTRSYLEASDPRWKSPTFEAGSFKVPKSTGHHRNFIDCVKSRTPCIAPPDVAWQSITPGFLGYVSHGLGRPLRWDAARRTVVGDAEAEALLQAREYRAPWKL